MATRDEYRRAILAYLATSLTMRRSDEIAEAINLSRSLTLRRLRELRRAGAVTFHASRIMGASGHTGGGWTANRAARDSAEAL